MSGKEICKVCCFYRCQICNDKCASFLRCCCSLDTYRCCTKKCCVIFGVAAISISIIPGGLVVLIIGPESIPGIVILSIIGAIALPLIILGIVEWVKCCINNNREIYEKHERWLELGRNAINYMAENNEHVNPQNDGEEIIGEADEFDDQINEISVGPSMVKMNEESAEII